ncbi:tetratricopeptide repeat protein 19, mitochondrial [Monodelphis domestica]|uniref:tetratricopeptide repeat protein 19, mitochondrial n=1 Tax=Monodelphis domestica TaxID=13616 RepID=UPI0024E1BE18|nr:tetratricopeptide repeat protein 19, mitochondrial [Monodelphis domestica]XP_056675663.1 tetratricopeptide repeat protein 19, mitochondrial [Monodelphis domestica]
MWGPLSRSLGRGLLAAASRRRRGYARLLLAGPRGGGGGGRRGAEVAANKPPRVGQGRSGRGLCVVALAALSWFFKSAPTVVEEEEDEEEAVEREEEESPPSEAELQVIHLLKRAKLCIMKKEPDDAERLLHQALHLAQKADIRKAIIYTYDMMANLAFMRNQLEKAEKLFKATMSYLLVGGMKQEDNAIVEISLKLASIYASLKRQEFAFAGYEFCISTLEKKVTREKALTEEAMPAEEKANTHLLLGMCYDSFARYLLDISRLSEAQKMYEKALQISSEIRGERHPQTVVLMNDLATTLDAQGRFDEAYTYVKKATELARQIEHPELHRVLSNMAGILMHKASFVEAKHVYEEALKEAELKGDVAFIEHIKMELTELASSRGV